MAGHGWVNPRSNGAHARCGGPAMCTGCALEEAGLPDTISDLARKLSQLHREHPTREMGEAAQLMAQMLDIAVNGDTWARPKSPQQVWLGLLAKVREMAAVRSGA
jgi:hypothetical protein